MKPLNIILILIISTTMQLSLSANEKLNIVSSILPLEFFIEQIGKDLINSSVMVPKQGNPHSYEPLPSQLKNISKADLYIKIGSGIDFELSWIDKLISLNNKMNVCNASKGVKFIEIENEHEHGHVHEREKKRHDPHVWLSPKNAMLIASNIALCMISLDPENQDFYLKNNKNLLLSLKRLDKEIRLQFSEKQGAAFIVFHPAWIYFANEYGLRQIPIEIGGKEPTAKELINIVKLARSKNINKVFVSAQFSETSAKAIAKEINGHVISVNPLAKNYISNIKEVSKKLSAGLK
ncbi:MAG: zinc ABC transporter substrate-binding protein [Pseudomonadota bacterium]